MNIAKTPEINNDKATYIKPISEIDYKKQGNDFTQKALQELKEQMANYKPKKHNIFTNNNDDLNYDVNDDINDVCNNTNSNNIDSDSDSESDYDMTDKATNINLIIKNSKKDKKISNKLTSNKSTFNLKSKKTDTDKSLDIENSMLKQFEKDNRIVFELKSICKKMDSDLHYLKLDLINSQCDKDNLEKELKLFE